MERVKHKDVRDAAKKLGFSDPGAAEGAAEFLQQAGACVRDHDHLRKMLMGVGPEERNHMYQSLRPHIFRFEPWPLDRYVIKEQQEAEELQLPVYTREGKLVAFKDYHGERPSLEVMAQDAIAQAQRESEAKGQMCLVCDRCTSQGVFPADNMREAIVEALKQKWSLRRVPADNNWKCFCPLEAQPGCKAHRRQIALCPKCAKMLKVLNKPGLVKAPSRIVLAN